MTALLVQPKLSDWFEKLVDDCQVILERMKNGAGKEILSGQYYLGVLIKRELGKRNEWGAQVRLAERLGISENAVSKAIAWSEYVHSNYGTLEKFYHSVRELPSWRRVYNQLLPQKHRPLKQLSDQSLSLREGIIEGDFRDADLPQNSIDLVLTDPPYGKEWIPLWGDLSRQAIKFLKPGGWLVAMSGQAYLSEVLAELSKYLSYHWIIALKMGPDSLTLFKGGRRIHNWWKPILIFCKPPRRQDWIIDWLQGSGREKSAHKWQQNVGDFKELIERFSKPGDTVWDPMAGSGTTIEACKIASGGQRKTIGHEIDPIWGTREEDSAE